MMFTSVPCLESKVQPLILPATAVQEHFFNGGGALQNNASAPKEMFSSGESDLRVDEKSRR